MEQSYQLKEATPREWALQAIQNLDALLLDHAACERKAAAMGISFVVQYPDRPKLIDPLIGFAREELEHFQQVCRVIVARGQSLGEDKKDDYVNLIHRHIRTTRDERLLDRLLAASVIEARGHERLALLETVLDVPELKALYGRLARAENRHRDFFLELAELYFSKETIAKRLAFFIEVEAEAIRSVPFRSAIH